MGVSVPLFLAVGLGLWCLRFGLYASILPTKAPTLRYGNC